MAAEVARIPSADVAVTPAARPSLLSMKFTAFVTATTQSTVSVTSAHVVSKTPAPTPTAQRHRRERLVREAHQGRHTAELVEQADHGDQRGTGEYVNNSAFVPLALGADPRS